MKPAKTEVQQLTGITVTARKREETLQDVPVAVTAFSADIARRLNVRRTWATSMAMCPT
jgi:iron complex outermembrane receptor protein